MHSGFTILQICISSLVTRGMPSNIGCSLSGIMPTHVYLLQPCPCIFLIPYTHTCRAHLPQPLLYITLKVTSPLLILLARMTLPGAYIPIYISLLHQESLKRLNLPVALR